MFAPALLGKRERRSLTRSEREAEPLQHVLHRAVGVQWSWAPMANAGFGSPARAALRTGRCAIKDRIDGNRDLPQGLAVVPASPPTDSTPECSARPATCAGFSRRSFDGGGQVFEFRDTGFQHRNRHNELFGSPAGLTRGQIPSWENSERLYAETAPPNLSTYQPSSTRT